MLSWRQVAAFRARLAELLASEGDRAGLEVHQEAGTDRLADLVNKDSGVRCLLHRPAAAGVRGPRARRLQAVLAQLPGRAAGSGTCRALHADWGGPVPIPAGYQVCNSIWLLDDFTAGQRRNPGGARARTARGNRRAT